jgi:uncharacterized protein Yka (UPF0111/DUF47 family)
VSEAIRENNKQQTTNMKNKLIFNSTEIDRLEEAAKSIEQAATNRINATPDNAEHGLAKLVLTLIELIRKLVEKQAIRRVEGGTLSDDEIERIGETLMKLENKMDELKKVFDLTDEDLNLDLGPLGDLM